VCASICICKCVCSMSVCMREPTYEPVSPSCVHVHRSCAMSTAQMRTCPFHTPRRQCPLTTQANSCSPYTHKSGCSALSRYIYSRVCVCMCLYICVCLALVCLFDCIHTTLLSADRGSHRCHCRPAGALRRAICTGALLTLPQRGAP
jgi:hypothetical protein